MQNKTQITSVHMPKCRIKLRSQVWQQLSNNNFPCRQYAAKISFKHLKNNISVEEHLDLCQASKMEIFIKICLRWRFFQNQTIAVSCWLFSQKTPSQMLERILNLPPFQLPTLIENLSNFLLAMHLQVFCIKSFF